MARLVQHLSFNMRGWTNKEVGRQHQGMDKPVGVQQLPEGSGEQGAGNLRKRVESHMLCPNDPLG